MERRPEPAYATTRNTDAHIDLPVRTIWGEWGRGHYIWGCALLTVVTEGTPVRQKGTQPLTRPTWHKWQQSDDCHERVSSCVHTLHARPGFGAQLGLASG